MTSNYELLPTGKPHVSFSEVKTWKECSYRHKLVHVQCVSKFQTSPALEFGTIVHDALEEFLKTRTIDVSVVRSSLERKWAEHVTANTPGFDAESLVAASKDAESILQEVPSFMDSTFPEWQTVDAEHALYEMIEGHPHAFKGFIDAVISTKDKRGKPIQWILDWKTSNRGWMRDKRQDETTKYQLALYKNYWLKKNSGLGLRDVRCGFVILKRSAKPGDHCELFDVSMGEVPIGRSLKVVNNMISSLKRGNAVKNRLSCTWCEFKETMHCT